MNQDFPVPKGWREGADDNAPQQLIAPGGCFPTEEQLLKTTCTLTVTVNDDVSIYNFTFTVESDEHQSATQNALLLKKKLMQEGIDVVTESVEGTETRRTLNTYLPNTFTKITISDVDDTVQSAEAECTGLRSSY